MTVSAILFLFLTHLGVGLAFTLLFVSRQAGVKFFRFSTGLAALLIAIGWAFRATRPPGVLPLIAVAGLTITELTLLVYWATVGRRWAKLRRVLLPVASAG